MATGGLVKFAKAEEAKLGYPDGFNRWTAFPFGGINLEADRIAIADQEAFWRENYLRIGDGYLRTLWDQGASVYTAPGNLTIISFFHYNIGETLYVAVFLSDGSAVQVNLSSGNATTQIGSAGTFYTAGAILPACTQWGTQYLLIASNLGSNAYWVWDGTNLYTSGTIGPIVDLISGGSNYSSAPSVVAYGGEGSGITATATVANGSVTGLTITDPGTAYEIGDIVQFQFTGGGSDTDAILTAALTSGVISFVEVTDGGANYTSPPTVMFSGGGGSGAAATAVLGSLGVASLTLTSGGSNYTAPAVAFTGGGGSGASASAVISGGVVTSVTLINGGGNYSSAPAVSFLDSTGTGASATAVLGGAAVVSITLTSGGSNYTGTPTVTINAVTSGSGASALAILNAGSVRSVAVTNSGSGYTATPTLSFEGGGGSGATATATISNGHIHTVIVTSGGSNYTGTPAVIIAPGSNNAAAAQAMLMPFGVSGSAIETFVSRVWLVAPYAATGVQNGGTMLISAPESLSDFASADGGDLFVSNEPFLRERYVNIKQSNGYLYPMGDSAVDVISNVQTGGSPTTTTFNYQNVDPQTSLAWRDTAQYFGLSILFANATGAFGLYGGAVKKISKKIARLFNDALFPPTTGAVTPSAAVASIYTIKCYLINMTVVDPVTKKTRTVMVGWDETDWFVASQSSTLAYIGTQTVASEFTAWGTDGKSLFPLFQTPSTKITKTFSTKLYGANSFPVVKVQDGIWLMTEDKSAGATGVSISLTADTENGSFVPSIPTYEFNGAAVAGGNPANDGNGFYGVAIGATLTSTSQDYVLKHLMIGYENVHGGYGSQEATAGFAQEA